jgi:hypothetical protein
LFTRWIPGRRDEFDERVLGPNASAAAKTALNEQLDAVLAAGSRELAWSDALKVKNVTEGFGRLDALDRIGNQVFATDSDKQANYAPISAPVHCPRICDAAWFEWVQYNGSIERPMVRNAGEALGVAAQVQLIGPNMFKSSVKVRELYDMEKQLAGGAPYAADGFTGLRAPRWSDTPLPPINAALAQQGAGLYAEHCQGCHMAPTTSPEFWNSRRWTTPNAAGERYLDLELIAVSHVGTDPAQASGMAAQPPTPASDRDRMNGYRDNGLQAPLKYKVCPLDGIWATPPYLHNGSVPNLYALLSPVGERPTTFYLGNREYDPEHVGYRTEPLRNGFKFDTAFPGNSNRGHEFTDAKGPSVIGPLLKDDERRALIEYLKTL